MGAGLSSKVAYPFKHQPHKMVKHSQIHLLLPTNCLRVFQHFVSLAFKGLFFLLFLLEIQKGLIIF